MSFLLTTKETKPLQIGVSFLLNTNRKSLVGFQNMKSDFKFGAP